MIDKIGNGNAGRVDFGRGPVERPGAAGRPGGSTDKTSVGGTLGRAAEMAAAGPPVEADRIAALRAAIAEGRYPIDPDRIAERMIALDLPGRA